MCNEIWQEKIVADIVGNIRFSIHMFHAMNMKYLIFVQDERSE